VACFNRTVSKVDEFLEGRAKGKKIIGAKSIPEFVAALKKPRKVMIMVRAGSPVDENIKGLLPHLEKGDIIVDGGNSNYEDTNRRIKELEPQGFNFFGAGVSGGEEGALKGPSIMPGGSKAAWEHLKPIFQRIAAKVEDGSPCCDYVGPAGSGHFVKMVHNGIEYGDMQLISEAYYLMKRYLGLSNEEIGNTFEEWNKGDLDSYLIEISRDIFRKKDEESGQYVLDLIVDAAGQKGTGKWTVVNGLDLGAPVTLIGEAVFARTLSSQKEQRVKSSKILSGPTVAPFAGDKKAFLNDIRDSVYAAKIVSMRRVTSSWPKRPRSSSGSSTTAASLSCGAAVALFAPSSSGRSRRRSIRTTTSRTSCWMSSSLRRSTTPSQAGGVSAPLLSSTDTLFRRSRLRLRITTASARRTCRLTLSRPSAITSAPTRTSALTSLEVSSSTLTGPVTAAQPRARRTTSKSSW